MCMSETGLRENRGKGIGESKVWKLPEEFCCHGGKRNGGSSQRELRDQEMSFDF